MAQPLTGLASIAAAHPARRWSGTAFKGLVSASVVALLFLRIPPAQVLDAATSTGLGGYCGVAVGLLLFLLLGALRVHLTVGAFARVPFRSVAWLYCRSVALGAFTPGQVGELFGLTYFLKRRGVGMIDSLAITAVDRVTTLATLLLLATTGLVLFAPAALNGPVVLLLIAATAGVLTLFIRPWRKQVRSVVERIAPGAVPFFEAFCRFFLSHPVRASINVGLGLARWVCAAGMLLVIIEPQLPVPVDRTFVLLANATARLVTYVPISINGIGVLELSAVELFKLGHVPAELTFAAFVVNRVVYYLFAATMVLGLAWSRPIVRGGGSAAAADWTDDVESTRATTGRTLHLGIVDGAFVFACCLVAVLAARRPFPDPDLGWHLAGGLWMRSAGQVPHQDPFGTQQAFWLCYSWLPELAYAAAYTVGGFVAVHLLEILTFVLVALCTCLYVLRLSRAGRETGPEIERGMGTSSVVVRASEWLTIAVVLSLLLPVCSLRPHVLSWIFLGVMILLFDTPRPSMLGVFALTLIWVNTHVYWILVPFVMLSHAFLQPAATRRMRLLGALAAVGTVATGFINPYGWRLFPGIHAMLFDQAVSNRLVFELTPLSVGDPSFPIYAGILLGVALCFRRVLARVGWTRVLLCGLLAAAGARSLKSLPLFAVSAAPLLVRGVFPALLGRIAPVRPATVLPAGGDRRSFQGILMTVAIALLSVLMLRETREQPFLRTPHRELFAIADVLEHDQRFNAVQRVNILSDANYGGWLDLAFWLAKPVGAAESRFRVAIDNRGLVAGEGRFDEYDRLRQMSGDWRSIMREWDIDVAVLPTPATMVGVLRAGESETGRPGWDVLRVGTAWTVLARPRATGQQKSN